MTASRKRGRPPRTDRAATERIEIRVTKLERAILAHAAAALHMTLSDFIRYRVFKDAPGLQMPVKIIGKP